MYKFIATAAFGLEAAVKREAAKLGFADISVLDGRVGFNGGMEAMAKANIHFRSADRIQLNMGEYKAASFDELFEGCKALPWDEWIPIDGKFTVTGKSVRSTLFSVPDIQSIVKKAVVEKLKLKYKIPHFEETGPAYTIQAALLKDVATLTIDTTGQGQGLHKRGYRPAQAKAPLKETMAASLIDFTYWKRGRIFMDPCCGSGTLPIEAALIAKNIAPGLTRTFACESWPQIDKNIWKDARSAAYSDILTDFDPEIYGSDIDPEAISIARYNAENAGVGDCIRFEVLPLDKITLPGEYGVAIINPPYGERLGKIKEVEGLYRDIGRVFNNKTWSVNVITPDEFFESSYGKRADAKRKLFNGNIKTDYYMYHGMKQNKS